MSYLSDYLKRVEEHEAQCMHSVVVDPYLRWVGNVPCTCPSGADKAPSE